MRNRIVLESAGFQPIRQPWVPGKPCGGRYQRREDGGRQYPRPSARHSWLLVGEGRLTGRLFGSMVRRTAVLPLSAK